jgi:protein-S-isoprenylcysteine O-methyltransferase Ste14
MLKSVHRWIGTGGHMNPDTRQIPDHDDHPGVPVRPPQIYLGFIVLGFVIDYFWPVPFLPPVIQFSGAAVLGGAGIVIALLAMRRFRAAGTNVPTPQPATAIVTDGIYAYSRNPIYIGMSLLHLAIGVSADSPWIIAALIPTLIVIRYTVITREEAYLERKFGDEYLAYKSKVRRWF